MTAIPVNPLTPIASQFVNGLDDSGNLLTSVVGFQDLDFTQIFGKSCTSTTENIVSYGIKVFTLDADVDNIKLDYTVQFRSIDPDVWMYGIVTGYSLLVSPAQITVNIIKISPLVGTYDNWTIQVVAGPAFGLPASAALGYSSNSFAIPAVGGTVAITTDAEKFMPSGSHVLMYALEDSTQYFVGIVNTYNIATGAINVFTTNVGPSATGTYANWAVQTIDGPAVNAQYISTSTTSLTIGIGSKTFATQAGKSFTGGGNTFGLILATDASNPANWMLGYASAGSYSGTSLDMQVYLVGGSGTIANWILQQVAWPTGPEIGASSTAFGMPLGPTNGIYIRNLASNFDIQILGTLGTLTAKRDLNISVNDADRNLTIAGNATISGTNTGDQNLFNTISVAGQSDIVADTTTDILTVAAGTGITLTTNATTDTLTITASGGFTNPMTTRGDMIVENATPAPARLAIGAAGTKLVSNGTDPSWGGGPVTIFSGSVGTSATFVQTGIPATYSYLIIQYSQVSSNTATRFPRLSVSTNNGSSYDTTAANYPRNDATTSTGILLPNASSQTAAQVSNGIVHIYGYQGGVNAKFSGQNTNGLAAAATTLITSTTISDGWYTGSTSAINAIQLDWNGSGVFDSGTITILGVP